MKYDLKPVENLMDESIKKLENLVDKDISIDTFKRYWVDYHEMNPQLKLNTSRAKELFNRCNCIGRKTKLIKGIEKSKLNGLDYLKLNL